MNRRLFMLLVAAVAGAALVLGWFVPASAQSGIGSDVGSGVGSQQVQGTPVPIGPIDALSTQDAQSAIATSQAIDARNRAVEAQAQATQAAAQAAQAAAQATRQAAANEAALMSAQSTSEAAILQSTIEAQATRAALEAQATQGALDELKRRRAATATAEAVADQVTATARAMDAEATREAYVMSREREEKRARRNAQVWDGALLIGLLALLALVLYVVRRLASVLAEWVDHLRPKPAPAQPVEEGDFAFDGVIDADYSMALVSPRMPKMQVVNDPQAIAEFEQLFSEELGYGHE